MWIKREVLRPNRSLPATDSMTAPGGGATRSENRPSSSVKIGRPLILKNETFSATPTMVTVGDEVALPSMGASIVILGPCTSLRASNNPYAIMARVATTANDSRRVRRSAGVALMVHLAAPLFPQEHRLLYQEPRAVLHRLQGQ